MKAVQLGWLTDLRMLRSRRRAAKQLETVFEMWVFIDTVLLHGIMLQQDGYRCGTSVSPYLWLTVEYRRSQLNIFCCDVGFCLCISVFNVHAYTFDMRINKY